MIKIIGSCNQISTVVTVSRDIKDPPYRKVFAVIGQIVKRHFIIDLTKVIIHLRLRGSIDIFGKFCFKCYRAVFGPFLILGRIIEQKGRSSDRNYVVLRVIESGCCSPVKERKKFAQILLFFVEGIYVIYAVYPDNPVVCIL